MDDVTLRPVRVQDLELLLAWRSNPVIYRHFREQDGPLTWESHVTWFASRPDDRRDLLIEFRGRRVGVVSVSSDNDVGIYIGETALWGDGIASVVLDEVTTQYDEPLTAEVHSENTASQRLFEHCGFERVEEDEWITYRFRP